MMSNKKSKSQKSIQVLPSEPIEHGYVVLPYDKDEFKDFIKSLLGSPQTITKTITGAFEVNKDDIRNLYLLITQRVTQQNEGVLADFSAKIVFSNNSSVELNSIEDLITYNEINPIVSRTLHLKWDFVVRFQDKKVPEKQRIQVSFVATGISSELIDEQFLSLGVPTYLRRTGGFVSFRIEHTARTWGADIEALLTNHIESIINPPSKISP